VYEQTCASEYPSSKGNLTGVGGGEREGTKGVVREIDHNNIPLKHTPN